MCVCDFRMAMPQIYGVCVLFFLFSFFHSDKYGHIEHDEWVWSESAITFDSSSIEWHKHIDIWMSLREDKSTQTNEYKSNWMWKRIGVHFNFWFFYLPKNEYLSTFDIWLFDFIFPFQCKRTLQTTFFFFIQFMIYNERSNSRGEKKNCKTFCLCMMQKKRWNMQKRKKNNNTMRNETRRMIFKIHILAHKILWAMHSLIERPKVAMHFADNAAAAARPKPKLLLSI